MSRSLNALYGWLLLLPAVVLAAFTHYPALATLWHSFYSTPRARVRPAMSGWTTAVMRDDPVFWQSLWNNLWFALGTIPTSIGIALIMALWVNRNLAGAVSCAWPTSRRRYCPWWRWPTSGCSSTRRSTA